MTSRWSTNQTNEQALEQAIQLALTGRSIESVKEGQKEEQKGGAVSETPADYVVENNGFKLGLPTDFKLQYALDEKFFWQFFENTQEDELEKIQRNNLNDWQLCPGSGGILQRLRGYDNTI